MPRCDTGWYTAPSPPSAIGPTTWTPDSSRAESATSLIIICPNPSIGISETSNLSVSGGRGPYTWYITAGGLETGTISADSTLLSADYGAPAETGTDYVAVLDSWQTYDDQLITISAGVFAPPYELQLWGWYKLDEGDGSTLYNSSTSCTGWTPLPDCVWKVGDEGEWQTDFLYTSNAMKATGGMDSKFSGACCHGVFIKTTSWPSLVADRAVFALHSLTATTWDFVGQYEDYTLGQSGTPPAYYQAVSPYVYGGNAIVDWVSQWLSGQAIGRWFFCFGTSRLPTDQSKLSYTAHVVDDTGVLSSGDGGGEWGQTILHYNYIVIGNVTWTQSDVNGFVGNMGDIIIYCPNQELTLDDWAEWYDELHDRYGMGARQGWP